MDRPKIAACRAVVKKLKPGIYQWCACGLSKDQPFCDGSHEGTGFYPIEFEITKKQKVALCQCKHTANPPLCDNTHQTVSWQPEQQHPGECPVGEEASDGCHPCEESPDDELSGK